MPDNALEHYGLNSSVCLSSELSQGLAVSEPRVQHSHDLSGKSSKLEACGKALAYHRRKMGAKAGGRLPVAPDFLDGAGALRRLTCPGHTGHIWPFLAQGCAHLVSSACTILSLP